MREISVSVGLSDGPFRNLELFTRITIFLEEKLGVGPRRKGVRLQLL